MECGSPRCRFSKFRQRADLKPKDRRITCKTLGGRPGSREAGSLPRVPSFRELILRSA